MIDNLTGTLGALSSRSFALWFHYYDMPVQNDSKLSSDFAMGVVSHVGARGGLFSGWRAGVPSLLVAVGSISSSLR